MAYHIPNATRRRVVAALAGAPVSAAFAQSSFPDQTVSMVVPFAPGGITDGLARLVANKLGARWGTPVVVSNKPGGGTAVATRQVATAPGDGRTLFLTAVPYVTNPLLLADLGYDPKALEPLILCGTTTAILYVNAGMPFDTVQGMVDYAKQNPGKLTLASSGNGTIPHLASELLSMMTGAPITHVPFQGTGPAMISVLGGQVSGIFDSMLSWAQVENGKLKPIAVASTQRFERVPHIPTFAEAGLTGFEAYSWFGFVVPSTTSRDLQARLFQELQVVLEDPEVEARYPTIGLEVVPGVRTQEDFRRFLENETARWSKVVRERNLKL